MHSGELARLAGVTIRALRHYHQVGVLAEPPRRSNGYREYEVPDLIRVLRIKRLAALGIALERMPELLDDQQRDAGALLDELDAELAGEIDRLTRQRELIARLRAHNAAPDLPPELAPFLAVFATADLPPELVQMDREQSILLAHLAGEDGLPQLTTVYARLSDPELAPTVAAISARFARLGPSSTDDEVADLVEAFVAAFSTVVADAAGSGPPIDLGPKAGLLSEYVTAMLNDRQRRVLEEIERRLGAAAG